MVFRIFRGSFILTALALIGGAAYGYATGGAAAAGSALFTLAILGILEVSLSFDNAVMNATVLKKMNEKWQQIFLTVGILIAVVGMRLVFPLLIVGITAGMGPFEAFSLAMAGGDIHTPGTYAYELHEAHPAIAAFGGMFLVMIFLDFLFDPEREIAWLAWIERPLAKVGRLDTISVVVALAFLVLSAETFAHKHAMTVLVAGVLGLGTYLLVKALGEIFESSAEESDEESDGEETSSSVGSAVGSVVVKQAGRAALMSFLYLEVLDASMSFDGVIGAFAITADPILIALGLGVIGSAYVRSLTVLFVRKGTLDELVYLEHGAHWAIGALAVTLFVSISVEVSEVVTGLLGVAFIVAALVGSILRNRRHGGPGEDGPGDNAVEDQAPALVNA